MDILADKLRGYLGLVDDLHERRDQVMKACEALMPHLAHVARTSADPARLVPIGFWMHRGGVPFVSPRDFPECLLGDGQADHRGALVRRLPDPVLRRGELGPAPRVVRRAAGGQHRLPHRPGRHRADPPGPRRQVLPERRVAQRDALERDARPGPRALQGDPGGRGPRRRLRHGLQRDRAERREGRRTSAR